MDYIFKFREHIIAVAVTLLWCHSVTANDTTAELATGGLVFKLNADIEMRSEDLYISTQQVRVVYRFLNTSPTHVRTVVAFPLPDITPDVLQDDVSIPARHLDNFLAFSTKVNGIPVDAKVEKKALVNGTDVSDYLRQLKIPIAPQGEDVGLFLNRLPVQAKEELVRLGIASVEEYDVSTNSAQLAPAWTLKTTFYWEQIFPSRTEIQIQHNYRPSVGVSAGTIIGTPGYKSDELFLEQQAKYCIEPDILQAVDRLKDRPVHFIPEWLSYILTTGSNWSGPIRDFRVVIDKGDPANLVSFCGESVKKIGPTTFEMRKKNFFPKSDIHVLFLRREQSR